MGLHDLARKFTGTRLTGEHALCGESLHLAGLRRVFDPLRVDPDLKLNRPLIALAYSNRSGSTWLGQLLASAPDLYGFREDLNHNIVARRAKTEKLPNLSCYLRHITTLGATHGAGFGLKASAEQLRLIRLTGIDRAFSETTVIRIRRLDRVAQAVSLWMARKTWAWDSRQEARKTAPAYSFPELRRHLESVQEAESALDLILSVLPYPVLSVEYETLRDDAGPMIAALRAGLGLPPFDRAPSASIDRQNSPDKDEIVERFRSDLARHWSVEFV